VRTVTSGPRSQASREPADILLAEDEKLVRQGIRMMIETAPDLRVTAEAATGLEAVDLCARRAFDLVILDIRMPELDGVTAAQRILARDSDQKVMLLTTFNDDEYALKALRLGVRGYLLKNADADKLIDSIRSVLTGGLPLEDQVAAKVLPRLLEGTEVGAVSPADRNAPQDAGNLTERETSVARLVGLGFSNGEIAAELRLSSGTVKNVVSAVLDKLGLRDRTQLAIFAIRQGWA